MSVPKLAQFRTQLDFITKTSRTSNDQISIWGVMKIPSKRTTETFTKTCVYVFKRSLLNRFRTQGKCILLQDWPGPEGQRSTTAYKLFERVRTMYYDHKLMSGTKLEGAVSPECSENVVSKRNLKNECKKPERQPLQRLQLCRRRLEKVEIIFLRCIWYTTERTIPRISKHFRKRWSY